MNSILKIIFGILVVVALVLGYLIYEKKVGSVAMVGTPAPDSVTATMKKSKVDAKTLLVMPSATSTEAQKGAYASDVDRSSVATSRVRIKACSPDPVIASVADGSMMTFENLDAAPQDIRFNSNVMFTVPAGSTTNIKASFGKGKGIYGYSCNRHNGSVGIILVK